MTIKAKTNGKLTDNQAACLSYLARFPTEMHPSPHMRTRFCKHPGQVLKRLADRGLVTAGAVFSDGACFQINDAGKAALKAHRGT